MGQPTPKQPVTDYTMSVHAGVAAGPIDAFLEVYHGEKLAWEGEVTTEGEELIRNTELHGGPRKEGGVEGRAYFLPGGPAQLMPEELAAKFGLTSATMVAYRGLGSIFFHGGITSADPTNPAAAARALTLSRGRLAGIAGNTAFQQGTNNGVKGKKGFYWQSNNPTLKSIWVKARRSPKGLLTENAMIGPDANPAHMIYECLTNTDWGMGASAAAVNTASFLAAAATLFEEEFGLSMCWVRQSTIEDMVSEIIDHINATIYVNPRDGLLTIKLLRDDYDADAAPLFTPANCTIRNFVRKGEGEIVNEVTVTYTDPANEKDASITQQNLAGIAAAGAIIPTGRNMYGIRNVELAAKVLNREVRTMSAPLAKTEMITNREGWDRVPGDVIRLTYPEHRCNEVVFRVGSINYGKKGSGAIRVNLVEDIFGFDPGNYTTPAQSQWTDTSQAAEPFDYQEAFTLPFMLAKLVDQDIGTYPNAMFGVLAASENIDAYGLDLQVETLMPDNTLEYGDVGFLSNTARGVLVGTWAAEAYTTVEDWPAVTPGPEPVVGGFAILGDGDETEREWVYIESASQDSNSDLGYLVKRGVMDTVPREWPAGTPIWFIDPSVTFYDENLWAAGASENYKLLMKTSLGRLDADEAPVLAAAATERPHLPYRPANVRVEGTAFADLDNPLDLTGTVSITVDWANRNRDTEDVTLLAWTDATVTPPAGQTTTVSVLAPDGVTVWSTNDGLTGTTYELDPADFVGAVGLVRVTSKLDGFESLQGHEIAVLVRAGGYGLDYGQHYGGS